MTDWVLPALPTAAPGEAAAALEIRLFGPLEVRIGPCPLPRLRSRKGLWLLALLALRAGRPVERDWLAGTLWPEDDDAHARRSLRQSLHDLRLALGPEAGRLTGEGPHHLRLELGGAFVDVLAFDAALARGDLEALEAAIRLYRGPLLEGCVEAWCLEERRPREEAYVAALERLAAAATDREELAAAERYLRLAVGADPYREDLQRALMEALAGSGSPAAALLVYRQFRTLLAREMAAEPAAETTALFRRLREETRARARPQVQEPTVAASRRRPDSGARGKLPEPLSAFVGRERELREVCGCIASARLVTLTGPGGIGKTRLAIRAAEECAGEYADGAWFVDLAALGDAALVPQAVARALQVREAPGAPLTETLQEWLRARQLLLVLDNCEHLLDACARLAHALLSGCPELHILATSRQALGIAGETVRAVPPLSLPQPVDGSWLMVDGKDIRRLARPSTINHQPSTLLEFEAVRLFVERSAAACSGFMLDESSARAVVQICQQLDGIPLAIELAAARLKALPVEQIAARLDDRFRLLTGGSRTALPRQQTLRATIDWSYDLLSEPERVFMGRLAVFAGGWTLEAAEAVCSDFGFRVPSGRLDFGLDPTKSKSSEPPSPPSLPAIHNPQSKIQNEDVLDLLTALVDKSLVVYERQAGRYRLLETVRRYFYERLLESGEGEATGGRHLDHFLALAEAAEPQLTEARQGEWLVRLEAEHDNLLAALAWCRKAVERGQWLRADGPWSMVNGPGKGDPVGSIHHPSPAVVEKGLRLAGALWRFWHVRGYLTEGREQLVQVLARAPAPTAGRAKALRTAGTLAYRQGDRRSARPLLEESLAICRQLGDRPGIAAALRGLGLIACNEGEYEAARSYHEESLAVSHELGDQWWIAASLSDLGLVAYWERDHGAARLLHEESLAIRRQLGDRVSIADSLFDLGRIAFQEGDYGAARSLYEESLVLRRELGDRPGTASSLHHLGLVACREGEYGTARPLHEESLAIRRQLEDRWEIASSLLVLGAIAYHLGDDGTARSRHEESLALRRELGDRMGIASSLFNLGLVLYQQGEYRAARSLYEESLAISREMEDACGIGTSLHLLGLVAFQQEEYEAARPLLEKSLVIRRELGDGPGTADTLEALAAVTYERQAERGVIARGGAGGKLEERKASQSAATAARLFGAAAALWDGAQRPPREKETVCRQVAQARETLGEAAFAAAWAEGRAMPLDQAIASALRWAADSVER